MPCSTCLNFWKFPENAAWSSEARLITDSPSPSVLGKLAPIRWIGARFYECHHWSPIHPGCLASVTSPLLVTTLWRCTRCTRCAKCTRCTRCTRCAQTCAQTTAPKNCESPAGCSRWAQRNRLPPLPLLLPGTVRRSCAVHVWAKFGIFPLFFTARNWTRIEHF